MKIAWFTPFPPEKSAIGEYSATVVTVLSKFCNVDIWISLSDSDDIDMVGDRYKKTFNIVNFNNNPELIASLTSYDAVIYNMGNNILFHKDIYEVSMAHPGIVILHDYVLHHFFAAYYLTFKKSNKDYVKDMEWNHGTAGRKLAENILSGKAHRIWETDDVWRYPLNRSALDNTLGVITHSNFVKERIKDYYKEPVLKLNFPTPLDIDFKDSRKARQKLGIPDDKILMLTFGGVIPNKRIDKVIKVLGENPDLAEKVIYAIIGKENRNHYNIRPLIEKYGLNSVRMLGYQPKEVLIDYISACDIGMNLRNPTLGESSWSLIQMLFAGKPAFVTKSGWYDELPDEVVVKIDPENEEEILSASIKALCSDKGLYSSMGLSAKRFAQDNFSTDAYCKKLIDFVVEVKQHMMALRLIDTVSTELSLMGVSEDMKVIDTVASEIYRIIKV
jgi:glycosyltransferase involved in cell wall biosynthesis